MSKKTKTIKPKIEKKEPVFYEKLELTSGEAYVGNLSDADKYQLLIRHIGLLETLLNNSIMLESNMCVALMELCKKNGIDINKKIDKE